MNLTLPRPQVFPTLCLVIAAYFMYHSVYGARGYWRMRQVREEIVLAHQVADDVRAQRIALERKVDSLSAESLDMDQLEESALRILNMASPSDQIILIP